jgi:hypothetical protein
MVDFTSAMNPISGSFSGFDGVVQVIASKSLFKKVWI